MYVDDLTIACSSDRVRDGFLEEMRQRFVIGEDEGGPVEWILGVKIVQDTHSIKLSQNFAIDKIAQTFLTQSERDKAVGVFTPAKVEALEKQETKTVPDSEFHMLSALGSLLYVASWTRPDISASVSILCRHAATPGLEHVKACKRIIMYLLNTQHLGIEYKRRKGEMSSTPQFFAQGRHPLQTPNNHLQTFVDSDYAADVSRRSMKGVIVLFGGGPVMWSSSLNKVVSMSTAEAEVLAAVQATKDSLHLKGLLTFLGMPVKSITLFEDNQACIAQCEGGLKHVRRAKHYAVWLHFLQYHVMQKNVKFLYTPTFLQLADLLTKNLPPGKEPGQFEYFASQLVRPVLDIRDGE